MQLRNSEQRWGLISITFHWVVAFSVLGLFILGLWMTSLSYYDEWYRQAPHLHKSIGILLAVVMLLRLLWRFVDRRPAPLPEHSNIEKKIAHIVHGLLYLLLIVIFISGYLISTADGRPIQVFSWFSLPATVTSIPNQEDLAGQIHYVLAIGLIALVVLHAAGAVKHHLIDKDETLRRMLGLHRSQL
ncbi:MAG: cytochrome b [Chromatiales bacterium]|nr:cytochrome b [Chromatiales bacterium]